MYRSNLIVITLAVILTALADSTRRVSAADDDAAFEKVRVTIDPPKDRARSESAEDQLQSVGLTKADLQGCKLHVVGIYRPAENQSSDEVFVEVEGLTEPSVIVVSCYYEALWRLRINPKSTVKLVILTGYSSQAVTVISDQQDPVPVLTLTYFDLNRAPNRSGRWAYAYSWATAEGRKLANLLYDITGLTADTFQGFNDARRLTIDGIRGRLTNRQAKEPIPNLLTAAEMAAEPIEFPEDDLAEPGNRDTGENEIDELYAAEANIRIAIRRATDKLRSVQEELAAADANVQASVDDTHQADPSLRRSLHEELRSIVAAQFQLQQQQRTARVELAALKLQLVQVRSTLRDRDRDAIIDQAVQSLLESSEPAP